MQELTKKVIFLHLPKTGGSSLHDMLLNKFDPQKVFPERLDKLNEYSQSDLKKYDFFSGHFFWYNLEKIKGEKHIITLFRDPKKRILSLYYFWKSHTYEYLKENNLKSMIVAKDLNLIDFLRYEGKYKNLVMPNIDNAVTWQLSDYKYNELLSKYNKKVALKMMLESALVNIDKIDSIGILEQMNKSIKNIMHNLQFEWDGKISKANTFESLANSSLCEHIDKEIITVDIDKELNRLTYADQILYDKAVNIFNKD